MESRSLLPHASAKELSPQERTGHTFRRSCNRKGRNLLKIRLIACTLLLVAKPLWGAETDPCSTESSVSDVHFSLALKDGRTVFQEGETIPLVLAFTSTTKNRYWADVRNYDRSGRLEIERYCVEPEGPDPLASYFRFGSIGGGLGTTHALDATPLTAEAELNEWRSPGPGRYKVYAISYRVWRPPDPNEQTIHGRISEKVRSNTVEFVVRPATTKWQREQLQSATQTLLGQSSPDDVRRAARRLHFLNTKDSTKQLAKLFSGLNEQPGGWDFMFGLYGSPYRQLAIDSMRAEFAAPDHAITSEFLQTLVGLEESADPSWDPPPRGSSPEAAQTFWRRRKAHTGELMGAEMQSVVAALPRKTPSARALTLHGLLVAGGDDPEFTDLIRPALIASWKDLPISTQEDLIQYRWPLIAGPEMLPILRRILTDPPPPAHTTPAMQRDAVLLHINELDPALGRTLILRELENVNAQPSLKTIELLPPEDIAVALKSVVDRIARNNAREVDYELLDRYADASVLPLVQSLFEQQPGIRACQPHLFRYFLRVDPMYGASQVDAALKARKETRCYAHLLQMLGDRLPPAQQSAIEALDDPDPELVQDAVLSLGFWGSADAESALWSRLQRFHQEWEGRADHLRKTPDYQSPGSRGAGLEEGLVYAIGRGTNWICPPDKLARLEDLVWTNNQHQQIESWIKAWKEGPALIGTSWFPEDRPTFSVLQYGALNEDQLAAKLTQFPRGTQLLWQFWQPGEIAPPVTMAKQEAVYERMRAVAEKHGITLGRANHP